MADFLAGGSRSEAPAPVGEHGKPSKRRRTVQEQAVARLHAAGQLAPVATGRGLGGQGSGGGFSAPAGSDEWWASTETDVLFTYLEGFSNAVRRPVGIPDLLGEGAASEAT